MPKATPAAEQFTALGINPADYTPAMQLAVKQKWGNLRVNEKVDVLRRDLAAVVTEPAPPVESIEATARAMGEADPTAYAVAEHKRLKRNHAVAAWRARNQIQAALDARDLKFKAMRAKRGSKSAEPALAGAAQ